jgi:streptogramin lyase
MALSLITFCFGKASARDQAINADDGRALATSINGPSGVTVDKDGNIIVVESVGSRVRKIDRTGRISTIGGNGQKCCFAEGKPAISVSLRPVAITLDPSSNIYVADMLARIRRIDAGTGTITTVVREKLTQNGSDPGSAPSFDDSEAITGLAVGSGSSDPSVLYAVGNLGHIYKIFNGIISIVPIVDRTASISKPVVGPFINPVGIAADSRGNLFIADYQNCSVSRIETASNAISTMTDTLRCKSTPNDKVTGRPTSVAVDATGNVFFASYTPPSCIQRVDSKTQAVTGIFGTCEIKAGKIGGPAGLAVDARGNVYFTLWSSNLVRKWDAVTGTVATVAGNGLPNRRDEIQ